MEIKENKSETLRMPMIAMSGSGRCVVGIQLGGEAAKDGEFTLQIPAIKIDMEELPLIIDHVSLFSWGNPILSMYQRLINKTNNHESPSHSNFGSNQRSCEFESTDTVCGVQGNATW